MTNRPDSIQLKRAIPASPSRVYNAWLDPMILRRWLAPGDWTISEVEIDPRVGGRYRVRQVDGDGNEGGFESEILELEPYRRIVFRWGFAGPRGAAGPVYDSILTIELALTDGGRTELTLIHDRLDTLRAALPGVADEVYAGWRAVIDKLALLVARAG